MANVNPPVKGQAFTLSAFLYTTAGALITNPGTLTDKISKDYGDFADPSGAGASEEDSTYGQIKIALDATDMNADVVDVYLVDNTSGCIPFTATIYTCSATRGLAGTALPNAAADAAGGLPISDAGALDLDTYIKRLEAAWTAALAARIDENISAAKTLTAAYDAAKAAAPAGAAMTLTAAYDAAKTASNGTGVTLNATQGDVTFGQVKIVKSVASEGALHIVNAHADGIGMYVDGGDIGAEHSGGSIGELNTADGAGGKGQQNSASEANGVGQYNYAPGTAGVGQSDYGAGYGLSAATSGGSEVTPMWAKPGDEMDLVDAPNETAVTAIQNGLGLTGEAATAAGAVTVAGYATGQSPADLVTGFSTHSAADVKTAMEGVGSHLTLIKTETDKLADTLEDDGGTYRFTENALEQAPSGTSTGATLEEIEGSTVLAKEATVEGVATDVEALDVKVSALGAAVVTVTSPVSVDAETVTLVCGDDYYDADGRALTFTDSGGTYPSFVGGSCKFTVRNLSTATDTETAGTVVDANTVRFELTKTATGSWPAGGRYRFDVEVTLSNGHEVTLAQGTVVMLAKYSG